MQKIKRRISETEEIPELTDDELKRARRVTPKETEAFRRAIEDKLGVPRPKRIGRPTKHPTEKYVPISWRIPPEIKEWLVAQARHAGVGKYQKFLSLLLRSIMHLKVVKERNGITLGLPNSGQTILIASEKSPRRTGKIESR